MKNTEFPVVILILASWTALTFSVRGADSTALDQAQSAPSPQVQQSKINPLDGIKKPVPLSPLEVTKDVVTSNVLTTSGYPILRTSWEIEVKNRTDGTYPTMSDPGYWKLTITCRHKDGTPSPKKSSKQEKFFGLQPGYSVGLLGSGKMMLDIDSQGLYDGECIVCSIKREVTVGTRILFSKTSDSPLYCPKPPLPR